MSKLLKSGIIAGPLFFMVWLAQIAIRDGYDPRVHPISLLANGDLGFVQMANFVGSGVLLVLGAVGLRRALGSGRASIWGPRLIAAFGAGFVVAGVFPCDPGAGFPAGAPAGAPDHLTVIGILHEVGFGIAQLAWILSCFVLRRRFAADDQRHWARACVLAAVAAITVAAFPHLESMPLRLAAATAIELGFVAALCAHHLRERTPAPGAQLVARDRVREA